MRTLVAVSGIIRRNDKILMIHQGDSPDNMHWFIPGGEVEEGELLEGALRREIREETGLSMTTLRTLAYSTFVDHYIAGLRIIAYVFEVDVEMGTFAPNDPDDHIHDVAYVPVTQAINRLERVPWAPMGETLRAYLRGTAPPATVWQYRQRADNTFTLVTTVT